MKTLLFFVLLSFSLLFAQDTPLKSDLLLQWGNGDASALSLQKSYRFATWNIYKGGIDGLYQDYSYFINNYDFVATQEFLLNSEQQKMIQEKMNRHWALAKSFQDSGEWTGVATISQWQPNQSIPVKSPGSEPFAGTPKMALISLFMIEDGRELMVVNVHGLNFNLGHGAFKEQIDDLVEKIKGHKGPMILAGDFNTWAETRLEHLMNQTKKLSLVRLNLENPMGFFNRTLDHIFYRELTVTAEMVLKDVNTSDHLPLIMEFHF